MGFLINKQEILKSLEDGLWVLDSASPDILKKIREVQCLLGAKNSIYDNSLKNLAIEYYCKIKSPLRSLFYDVMVSDGFNQIILDKVGREGAVSGFSQREQEVIILSLGHITRAGAGHVQFINELSFVKMYSSHFRSATSPHLIGAIILTDQISYNKSYELTRSIIHELAHNELFLINFYDRLTIEKSDGINTFSPYQGIIRPPIGRLHSLWALFRMIQFGRLAGEPIQSELVLFNQTLKTLEGEIMTSFGKSLIKTIQDCIEKND